VSGPGRPGEEALIARYFAPLAGEGAEGLRDDAASLAPTPGHDLVVTTDAIVAGMHFFPDDPPASIARKALGVNLSDIAAKGADPRGFLLTLALPSDWTEAWLAGFAEGLGEASRALGCPLLGGDTVRTDGPLLIGVTAFGEVPSGGIVRRQTARPGDLICVSGTIGDAALGLALRLDPGAAWATALSDGERAHLADRYLHPRPRTALAGLLRRHATAAMDVSDGLVGDLGKMLGGGTTARVDARRIPHSSAARHAVMVNEGLIETILCGGDDYELIFCIPEADWPAIEAEACVLGVDITMIGQVADGQVAPEFIDLSGNARGFARRAFEHF